MPKENGPHSYHEVRVTKGLKSKEEAEALAAFIGDKVHDFQGETQQGFAITEEHFRIPKAVFTSPIKAHSFAREIETRFGIPSENIVIKAKTNTSGTDSIPKLIDELKRDDGIQSRKARLALVKLGSIAVPALIEATKSPDTTVQWESLKALAQIGNRQAIDTLIDHLSDDDGRGWVAADGLARLGKKAIVPVLESLVHRSGSSVFRNGVHHFLSELSAEGQDKNSLEPVKAALEGSEASLEAPIAAWNAISKLKSK
ncbi:hypothetical protein DGWBC_0136 [Dehalogenimonas sp. WBC-2]|nr:hypothetical protein DGWBC_0136 [Dehalogenimonas sp. WBC-2]